MKIDPASVALGAFLGRLLAKKGKEVGTTVLGGALGAGVGLKKMPLVDSIIQYLNGKSQIVASIRWIGSQKIAVTFTGDTATHTVVAEVEPGEALTEEQVHDLLYDRMTQKIELSLSAALAPHSGQVVA